MRSISCSTSNLATEEVTLALSPSEPMPTTINSDPVADSRNPSEGPVRLLHRSTPTPLLPCSSKLLLSSFSKPNSNAGGRSTPSSLYTQEHTRRSAHPHRQTTFNKSKPDSLIHSFLRPRTQPSASFCQSGWCSFCRHLASSLGRSSPRICLLPYCLVTTQKHPVLTFAPGALRLMQRDGQFRRSDREPDQARTTTRLGSLAEVTNIGSSPKSQIRLSC